MQAYNLLSNGMGGLDWAGLPIVAAYLGISRVEPLLHALAVIKAHKPPRADDDSAATPPHDPMHLNRSSAAR